MTGEWIFWKSGGSRRANSPIGWKIPKGTLSKIGQGSAHSIPRYTANEGAPAQSGVSTSEAGGGGTRPEVRGLGKEKLRVARGIAKVGAVGALRSAKEGAKKTAVEAQGKNAAPPSSVVRRIAFSFQGAKRRGG